MASSIAKYPVESFVLLLELPFAQKVSLEPINTRRFFALCSSGYASFRFSIRTIRTISDVVRRERWSAPLSSNQRDVEVMVNRL
jgi:hypothetical protein